MDITNYSLPTELADRERHAPKLPYPGGVQGSLTPDLGALYPVAHHGGRPLPLDERRYARPDTCENYETGACPRCAALLTPRLAHLLHAGAQVAADTMRDRLDEIDCVNLTTELSWELPGPVLRALALTIEAGAADWLRQFVATLDGVAALVAVGELPAPRCTAEEMALHIAIHQAQSWVETTLVEGFDPVFDTLAATDEDRDVDLNFLSDVLFEDHDVLMLFDAAFDGFGDPGEAVGAMMGTANLSWRDWFKPFRDEHPVTLGPTDYGPVWSDAPMGHRLADRTQAPR